MTQDRLGEKIRVFVAIELPDSVKTEFHGLITAINALGIKGTRTVRPQGIHLTLKFLGDVSIELIPQIQSAMDAAASGAEPFDLALGDAGVFPNPESARVLWVGVSGDIRRLNRLRQSVERSLSELGFRPERRGFNPHITAGRIRDSVSQSDRRAVTDALFSHRRARPPIRVENISLIQSILNPDGATYQPIYSAALSASDPSD